MATSNLFAVRLPPGLIDAIAASGRDRSELVISGLNHELGTSFAPRPRGGSKPRKQAEADKQAAMIAQIYGDNARRSATPVEKPRSGKAGKRK